MKKQIILFTALLTLFVSCSPKTRDEIVKQNLETLIKSTMADPENYEFASLQIVDSVNYKSNIKIHRDRNQSKIESLQWQLDRQDYYKKALPSLYSLEEIQKLQSDIANQKLILAKIDSISAKMGKDLDKTVSYMYAYTIKSKNKLGDKIPIYYVQTGIAPNYTILNLTDNATKILLTPNDFPGYKELISQYE